MTHDMKIGSVAHKELFCRSFIDTYHDFEPEHLPWPKLDDTALAILRGIPFWEKAFDTEREAGVLVNAYAEMVSDPVLKEAIALQGKEESRHARLIKTLIERYGIEVAERPAVKLKSDIEQAFTVFGFEECLDTFFAFGLFDLARETGIFPEQLFTIFDPIIDEEARHIVFFVNWFTYMQASRNQGFVPLRMTKTLWYYSKALSNLVTAFSGNDNSDLSFTATGASSFTMDLTPEKFLSVSLAANKRRMSKFDKRLLQPQLIHNIASIAYNTLQLIPKRKPQAVESPNLG
ncbi:MAG: ferritin-like domain-containing protein [Rhizonema sp. PD38]|nr:ferritin-like domain-containing protein [Rhizonema sp. PD38]